MFQGRQVTAVHFVYVQIATDKSTSVIIDKEAGKAVCIINVVVWFIIMVEVQNQI